MKKIFVACPGNTQTGGVELLHQLTHELNQHPGVNAFIWHPYGGEIPEFYKNCYHNQEIFYGPQDGDTVIFPEIWAWFRSYTQVKRVMFWESVDNFVLRTVEDIHFSPDVIHLTQSCYASDFVRRHYSTNEIYCGDYLNKMFFQPHEETERKPIVFYNPAKGMDFTRMIIDEAKDIEFVALRNMTPEGIRTNLLRGMIYIDFGDHPGKDRLPREAAMCGCCVITGRNGSAGNPFDVPIIQSRKIPRDPIFIDNIIKTLRYILGHYKEDAHMYDEYRLHIKREEAIFKDGITELLKVLS